MAQPTFFEQPPSSTLAEIAALTTAHLVDSSRGGQRVRGLASLDEAGPMHLTFFDNLKYAGQLASTKAGACLVSARFEASPLRCRGAAQRPAVPRFREHRPRALQERAPPAILVRQSRHRSLRGHRSQRASGGWRDRRSAGGDRPQCRNRRRYGDRGGRHHRGRRQDRPGLQYRRADRDPVCADGQQRADPSRLQHRPGWLSVSSFSGRTAI